MGLAQIYILLKFAHSGKCFLLQSKQESDMQAQKDTHFENSKLKTNTTNIPMNVFLMIKGP